MKRIETAVVGGGPAGAAAACGLAALDREVMLIERSRAPHHKVCGEFLSVETQAHLRRLGIDAAALGAAPIGRVSVTAGRRTATADLPFRALSLSRFRLDHALLQRAAERGADVRRGVSVRAAWRESGGWMLPCDDGETIQCRHLVLATGKWGLRGIEDERDTSLVGLKMHFKSTPEMRHALEGCVELSLFDSTYAGLELVEEGIANLALLLPRAVVARIGPGWPALHDHLAAVMPSLAERLRGAVPRWDKPLAVVCPSGGHLQADGGGEAFRIGDRLGHIPPFTGDGLAIALASAALAVEHIQQGRTPQAYLAAARRLTAGPIRLASAVSGIAANRVGRTALMHVASLMPGLIGTIARRTRLPVPPALPPAEEGHSGRLAMWQSRR
ncbi:MAG TPA: FAD-dependent monooxygenase [Pseudolabrys sp.]|nr:FAD-dependent monooxygenase [Pseudolabrys sp.]